MRIWIWCLMVLVGLCSCKVKSDTELPAGKYELLGLIDGNEQIEMNLKINSEGNIKGNYTIKKSQKSFDFKGNVFDNDKVTLFVENPSGGDDALETWNLTAESDEEDVIMKGTITDNKGKTKKVVISNDAFNLKGYKESDSKSESAATATAAESLRKLKASYISGGMSAMVEPQYGNDYLPQYLFNGNNAKCWSIYPSEADYAGATSTTVYASLDGNQLEEVQVYNGYQKNADIYRKNSRPKRIYIALVDGGSGNETVIYNGHLQDSMGAQTVARNLGMDIGAGDQVKIEIFPNEVYYGSKYEDLCLSGVVFKGK